MIGSRLMGVPVQIRKECLPYSATNRVVAHSCYMHAPSNVTYMF
jgi:hypothetical protein